MHLRNFIILVSISVALSSQPKNDNEVLETDLKSFILKNTNQLEIYKMLLTNFSPDNISEKTIKALSPVKYGKSIKADNKDIKNREIKLDTSPVISRLSDDIVNKIRKLLENEIKEINKLSEKRSNSDQETSNAILFSTSQPFHSGSNVRKEKENFQDDNLNNRFEPGLETNNRTTQKENKISLADTEFEFKKMSIEVVPDANLKKNSSLETMNERKPQNTQINSIKIFRNGGIENNFSRRAIGKPSRRSELSGFKQKTQEVISNKSTVYLQIFSSLERTNKSNLIKPDQESSTPVTLKTHVQQSSENLEAELNDAKNMKQNQPMEIIQSRTNEKIIEPKEDDFIEAANFGMQTMNNLYYIKEPKLYSLGLFLAPNNPAYFVANFNEQTEEARYLAKFGYAALQGSILFINKYPDISRNIPFTRSTKNSVLHRQCPRRGIPQCTPASMKYRTADGSCNNAQNLWWGSAMSTMHRFLPPFYQDGIQSIRRSINRDLLPSAREISNFIHEKRDIPLASVSHMLMQWGQFIDHDITASVPSRGFNGTIPQCCLDHGTGFQPPEFMHPECLPIAVHPRDNFFSRFGVRCLEFLRNGPAPRENCEFGPREQVFQVTSYLDASTIYGSNVVHADSMRIFREGLLLYGKLQSRREFMTHEESDICKLGSLNQSCFISGDGRVGENPALTSLHVVFLRLHNRIVTQIAALNPHWSDEKMFQETRKIVGAIIQHITYREFLPIVLGQEVMKIFQLQVLREGYFEGYDPSVNPNVVNEFATAAFRFGHSLVQPSFARFDKNHRLIFNNVSLHEEFVNPHLESAGSLAKIMLGLVNQPSQKRDEFISEELTNHLFQREFFPFGMDLASINIQRGRDHGIPPYVQYRSICGLSEINDWQDLEKVMEVSTARKFQLLYSSIEDIDLFSAGLSEKSVGGGLVGPTFACIIAQQFSNLKKGDRFWFENSNKESRFTPQQLQQIRSVTLAQVLCKTMDNIENLQPFVMQLPDKLKNQRISCDDSNIGNIDVLAWLELPPDISNNSQEGENLKPSPEVIAENMEESQNTPENVQQHVENLQKDIEDFQENVGSQEILFRSRGSFLRPDNKNKGEEKVHQPLKPLKTSVNQQNKIVLKRPIAPQENISIMVHNVAVNAPVFVKDSIYGSHLNVNSHTPSQFQTQEPNKYFHISRPQFYPGQRPTNFKPSRPTFSSWSPYIPQNFQDSSNPNPPSYGFNYNPVNNYIPDNIFFQNMYNNNYSPKEDKPNYNQESFMKPFLYDPFYDSDNIRQNSWEYSPEYEDYQIRPMGGTNQNFYNYNANMNWHNFNRPIRRKPSGYDNSNLPITYQPKQVNQKDANYEKPITESTTKRPSSPSRRPTQNKSAMKMGTINPHQWSNLEYTNSKFSDVSKTLETVTFAETVQATPTRRHKGELPKPLTSQRRIIDAPWRERSAFAGPGLHYFDRNILYKYPQKFVDKINVNSKDMKDKSSVKEANDRNESKEELKPSKHFIANYKEVKLVNSSRAVNYTVNPVANSMIQNEIKFTTTPTIVLANDESNPLILIQKPENDQKNNTEKIIDTFVKQDVNYEHKELKQRFVCTKEPFLF